jgi:Na+-driven multidrug efflux pump
MGRLTDGLAHALEVGAWAAFVSLRARGDTAELAAHVLVIRIVSVSFLPGQAFGEAGAVFVGQAIGAGRPELARQAWRASARLAVVMMSACAFAFVAVPDLLMRPFAVEPAVLAVGRELMVLGALFQIVDAIVMAGQSSLTGAGDTRYVLVTSVGSAWLVQVPLAWWVTMRLGLGAPGAWVALTLTLCVVAGFTLWRLHGSEWLRHPVGVVMPEPRDDDDQGAQPVGEVA